MEKGKYDEIPIQWAWGLSGICSGEAGGGKTSIPHRNLKKTGNQRGIFATFQLAEICATLQLTWRFLVRIFLCTTSGKFRYFGFLRKFRDPVSEILRVRGSALGQNVPNDE